MITFNLAFSGINYIYKKLKNSFLGKNYLIFKYYYQLLKNLLIIFDLTWRLSFQIKFNKFIFLQQIYKKNFLLYFFEIYN